MFLTKNHAICCNTVKVMVKLRGKITPSGRFCHQYSRRVKVYNTFDFDEDVDDYDILKELFRKHCEPRKNLTNLRHTFFTRAQGKSETIDAYVTDLKNKAKECKFGHLTDSLIQDRILCGIVDDQIRETLL